MHGRVIEDEEEDVSVEGATAISVDLFDPLSGQESVDLHDPFSEEGDPNLWATLPDLFDDIDLNLELAQASPARSPTAHFSDEGEEDTAAIVEIEVEPEEDVGAIESDLSEISIDKETGLRTGSRKYMIKKRERAYELMHLDELEDPNVVVGHILDMGIDLRFDPSRADGYLAEGSAKVILSIIARLHQINADFGYRHVRNEDTGLIERKNYTNMRDYVIHPWFYVTREPRQLGVQEMEQDFHLISANAIFAIDTFSVRLNIYRSKPNQAIYQSQMKIPFCGVMASLRAFTNLNTVIELVSLLFGNLIARDNIGWNQLAAQDKLLFWFQVKMGRPTDLDPKKLNKITMTTDIVGIPFQDDEKAPYALSLASIYFTAWFTARIEAIKEGIEYFELIDEDNDDGHVDEVSLFILALPPQSAGCRGYFGNKYLHQTLMRYAYDPPARENNCFFYCIYRALGLPENIEEARIDRGALCYRRDQKVSISHFEHMCEYFHIYISLYHVKNDRYGVQRIAHFKNYGDEKCDNQISLLIKASHFCLITNAGKLEQFRRCAKCYSWKNITKPRGREHLKTCRSCPKCGLRWSLEHACRGDFPKDDFKQSRRRVQPIKEKQWIQFQGIKNVFVADFETFQPVERGEQIVYAAGFMEVSDIKRLENKNVMRLCYGETALDNFCNTLLNIRTASIFVFYNGSRFDFWFILRWLLKHNIKIIEILREKKSNKIMRMEFGQVKLWDLCLFSLCSLNDLGKGLSIPSEYRKKEFDHKKMKTWNDVMEYKDEVKNYLYYDVLCLGLCHIKFVEKAWELYHYSAIKCITLSHFAYQVWMNNYIEKENVQKIKLPTDEEYDYLRRGLFGGRCTPYRKGYKASGYVSYDDLQLFNAENQTAIFKCMTDHLILLDVVSLYPYVAKQGFPVGTPKWRNGDLSFIKSLLQRRSKEWRDDELDLIKRSFVEVDVMCPCWLPIPFLFARGPNGELIQDLLAKKKQIYDGETILEALILEYKIINVHSWLVYPNYEVILDRYMTNCFDSKAKAKKDGNDAEYLIHKIMANGCTGKFNQQVIDSEQHLFYQDSWIDYMTNHDELDLVKRVEWLKDENDQHLGFYVEKEKERDFTKPLQIGVCILAKSRVLMSEYTRKMGGYADYTDVEMKNVPYYTDTDSLLVHYDTYIQHRSTGIFGTAWGQMDDELGAHSKIVAFYCPAPKTYAIEYWRLRVDGTVDVKWKIRAKGIPKGRDGGTETLCPGAKEFAELEASIMAIPMKPRELNELLFSLYDREGKRLKTTTTLPFYFFEHMMCKDCYVIVHFGKLRRFLIDSKGLGATVQLNLDLHRSINKERWWKEDGTGKRTVITDDMWGPSVPRGHIALT